MVGRTRGTSSGWRAAWALAAACIILVVGPRAYGANAPEVPLGGAGELHEPMDTTSGGVITGLVFDGVGMACVLIAAGFTNDDELKAARLNCLAVASMSLTLGGIVGTIAYSSHHSVVQRAGYEPRGSWRTVSWVLTGLTAASFAASTALAIASEEEIPSAIDLSGGAAAAAIFAVAFEGANLAVRELWWKKSLESAPRTVAQSPGVHLVPVIGVAQSRQIPFATFGFVVRL